LKGEYQTKTDARRAIKTFLNNMEIKIVKVAEKGRHMKTLVAAGTVR